MFNNADPSVNPYLAYSAIIVAGIDGIKNKIDPGDPLSENEEEAKENGISCQTRYTKQSKHWKPI